MELAEYLTMYRAERDHWWYVHLRDVLFSMLEKTVPTQKPLLVLDAGCGTGANLSFLSDKIAGARFVGIDRHPMALEFARGRAPRASLMQSDIASLPFAAEVFDVVLSADVLPIVENDTR